MSLTGHTVDGADSYAPAEDSEKPASESWPAWLRRIAMGLAWALKPPRTTDVPAVLYLLTRYFAGLGARKGELPNPDKALGSGIAGICADLDVDTLLGAYRKGLYPFSHIGPQKWWAPKKRMILAFENFDMEKNLRRRIRNKHFDVTFDKDFEAVMRGCAEPRPGRPRLTWITPEIISAYCALFEAGHAHSVEVWDKEGKLVGGAYGVSIGGVFITESQFNRARDAAKVGFAMLNCHLQHWGYILNDGKNFTAHLHHVGFELIGRRQFGAILKRGRELPGHSGPWEIDDTLDVGNWDPKATVGLGAD